ncbi:serpin family protein [Lujinxingia litoralis]|uniref:Serpin family protein n=1 Tax=Lujinxingia litoralis TaxID=2211119 RepID=A0A328C9Z3_9DELT|nr:serpin family protein [Lujinxingia litoralis]RAL22443.1 serpin family protein [Lujinxingia litoralis]
MFRTLPRHLLSAALTLSLAACATQADEYPNTNPEPQGPGDVVRSDLSRIIAPEVDASVQEQLAADNRDFAFNLFGQLREEGEPDENIFVSPHSISIALAMTYGGAEEATKAQMAEALRFTLPDEALHPAFNYLDQELASRATYEPAEEQGGEPLVLQVINQTWGQQGFHFESDFLDLLALHYGADMRVVDFVTAAEDIRQEINEWVETQTEERIQDLLPSGVLSSDTRMVLVNAIYFYGSWLQAFDESQTNDAAFTLLDGSEVQVPMMKQQAEFGYYEDDTTVAASLPYVGEEASMIVWMPADAEADFGAWEEGMTRESFDVIAQGVRGSQEVEVTLPRFESEGDYALVETLKALGMEDAFDFCAADFGGMTGADPCIQGESLYISEILHKSFVSVDEKGTEAAAATAVIMDTETSVPAEPASVRFDRPFYYAVYDQGTGTLLFMGRMLDPS